MMLDADIVAVNPSGVYRVLVNAGVLREWKGGEGIESCRSVKQRQTLLWSNPLMAISKLNRNALRKNAPLSFFNKVML